jgi:hypothetical protein
MARESALADFADLKAGMGIKLVCAPGVRIGLPIETCLSQPVVKMRQAALI